MRLTDLLLVVISHNNGRFVGRSLIQKAVFFLNELGNLGISFSPHYYGPYSMDVAVALENLICTGFLSETERYVPNWNVWGETKKCTFKLTNDGKQILSEIKKSPDYKRIKDLLNKLGKFSKPEDYDRLSKAAKIYHRKKYRYFVGRHVSKV